MGKTLLDFSLIDLALDACRNDSLSTTELLAALKQIHQGLTGTRSANAKDRKAEWASLVYQLYTEKEWSMSSLATGIGCSAGHLSHAFKRYGYRARSCTTHAAGYSPRRKFSVDAAVFDVINSDAAYWLGFLWADGRVLVKNGRRPEGLKLVLAPRDAQHLVKLRKFLKSESPITRCSSRVDGKNYEGRVLSVYSTRLASRLMQLGILPRRSTCNFDLPRIPRALAVHFMRGLFDGDGYIKRDKRVIFGLSGWEFGICGSLKTVVFVEEFARYRGLRPNGRLRNGRSAVNWRFALNGPSAIRMLRALYEFGGPSLDRKRIVAEQLIGLENILVKQGVYTKRCGGKKRFIGVHHVRDN